MAVTISSSDRICFWVLQGASYTFSPHDQWGDGWDDDGWFEILAGTQSENGDLLAGGEAGGQGIVLGDGTPSITTFEAQASTRGTVSPARRRCHHITSHRCCAGDGDGAHCGARGGQ